LLRAASLGIEIAVAVFLGAFIGYQIDIRLKSLPLAMSIGVIIGAIAGMWNAIKIALKEK
jgi:F0F1-type ATP synthase assembly protein I